MFTADNGVQIAELPEGSLSIEEGQDYRVLPHTMHDALEQFFAHSRDEELGRQRDPENNNMLWYVKPGDDEWVRVTDECSGLSTIWCRDDLEDYYATSNYATAFYAASQASARRYFGGVASTNPWRLAEEGDVWELTIDGEAGAYRMVQDAFVGHRRYLHETDGKIITASRKVWPDNE